GDRHRGREPRLDPPARGALRRAPHRRDAQRHDHEVTMAGLRYLCCSDARRAALEQRPDLNGIDFLEVDDLDPTELDPAEAAEYAALPVAERDRLLWQRRLEVFFVNPLLPAHLASLTDANFRVTGGERPEFRSIALTVLATATQSVVLRASKRGDFSVYRLVIVTPGDPDLAPPAVFDPLASAVGFSFNVPCPSDFDCPPEPVFPPETAPPLTLDDVDKDYASFRRLMLDRMAALAPAWRERHAADLGVTLVEALAYAADYLSYRQDAVATEAYLGTARRRVSLRRHARLVDYIVREGANARAWTRVFVSGNNVTLDGGTALLTRVPDLADVLEPGGPEHRAALAAGAETFETVADEVLFQDHERFDFWTWGDEACCLPRRATSATLLGHHPQLQAGDVLVFAEVAGPLTGAAADADPAKRVAVRLTNVVASSDPSGGLFADPPTNVAVDVTEIDGHEEDALAFPVCISVEEFPGLVASEAWGNIVLADHGRTIAGEPLGEVPEPVLFEVAKDGCDQCEREDPQPIPIRFRPTLANAPVTQ